jgi:glycine reductase
MARSAGANRILAAGKIPHPVGDPSRTTDEEFAWRRGVVRRALDSLTEAIEEATIF